MNNEIKQLSDLESAIIKTMAFFDIFDYPLTLLEAYKWLFSIPNNKIKINLSEVLEQLEELKNKKIIETQNGFYFFPGRKNLIDIRRGRYLLAENKFKIASRAAKILRVIPFIKMIGVCNNAAYANANRESDIDFFIIVRQNRLWLTRLFITFWLSIFGLRRRRQLITNRICLSFYLTDDQLNLEKIAIQPKDPYLIYWLATLAPIYRPEFYFQFLEANFWLKNYLANFYPVILNQRRFTEDNILTKIFKTASEKIFSGFFGLIFEKLSRFIQRLKMKANKKSLANFPDTRVIISDAMLKFHETDRRQDYFQVWQEKLISLGIND